jgi:hypothetical protein
MGFSHQLQLTEREELPTDDIIASKEAKKVLSLLWFVPYALFLATLILFMLYSDSWWKTGVTGVLLSQILIILDWHEAKYGTLVNILILTAIIAFCNNGSFI